MATAVRRGDGRAPPTCVLADDHQTILSSLTSLLESEGFAIVGSTDSGAEAIRLLERHQPGVAVLDFRLRDDRSGIDVAREAAAVSSETVLLLYTAEADTSLVRDALAVGIRSVVLKAVPPTHLLDAIAAALAGEIYVDPAVGDPPCGSGPRKPSTEFATRVRPARSYA